MPWEPRKITIQKIFMSGDPKWAVSTPGDVVEYLFTSFDDAVSFVKAKLKTYV